MQIHTLNLFPEVDEITIEVRASGASHPLLAVGEINIFLMQSRWDAQGLYGLAEQLVQAGRKLAVHAGQKELAEQAQQVEDQEAV